MKFFLYICLTSLAGLSPTLAAVEGDSDGDPMPLVVFNGDGDNVYPMHTTVGITAQPTLNGSQFITWIIIEGPSNCIDNPTSPTASLRTGSTPTRVAAIYGNAKVWYPGAPEPSSYTQTDPITGLFTPKPEGTGLTQRRKMKLKVKIEAGELGQGHEAMIFKMLAFTFSWWPDNEGVWHSGAVEFYTHETGGTQLSRGQHLSLTGKNDVELEPDPSDPGQRTITLWYEPKWTLADLDSTSPTQAARKAPTMKVVTTLEKVLGESATGGAYTLVKEVDSTLLPASIYLVRFQGPNHELTSDDQTIQYVAPQWVDKNEDGIAITNVSTGEKNYPVAYTRKTRPIIGARMKIEGFSKNQPIQFKATSPQGIILPVATITPNSEGTYVYPVSRSDEPGFVDSVQFYDQKDSSAFQLDWQIKLPQDEKWAKFANSKHTVCITNADPSKELLSKQETLFVIACKNAIGKTTPKDITAGIWSVFTQQDKTILTVDNKKLTYYDSFRCTVNSTQELIKGGDGKCDAWARFFIDLLKVHGIKNSNNLKGTSKNYLFAA